ncbi:MAG: hypothetical protein V3R99_09945 [Thermoguttaceae bacterium]
MSSGTARLTDAMDSLQIAYREASQHWDDRAQRQFAEEYLEPLEPRFRRAIEAVRRLAQVLAQAEQECGDES